MYKLFFKKTENLNNICHALEFLWNPTVNGFASFLVDHVDILYDIA